MKAQRTIVTTAIVAITTLATNAFAGPPVVNRKGVRTPKRIDQPAPPALGPNPSVIADACPATNVGVLASSGSTPVVGTTIGATDGFVAGCGSLAGGRDQIYEFTVDGSGTWSFDTCGTCWNTTIEIREETGGGCPGTFVACDGDSCDVCYYESALSTFLTSGTTYYLIVDGWASYTYGNFTVNAANAIPACTNDAFCSDGVFCNGAETCDVATSLCIDGTPPCATFDGFPLSCDEAGDICEFPADNCTVWLGGAQLGSSFFSLSESCGAGETPPTEGLWHFDDIQWSKHTTNVIDFYTVPISGSDLAGDPLGSAITIDTAIWTVEDVTGNCNPLTIVPGASCNGLPAGVIATSGTPSTMITCQTQMPQVPNNSGDMARCEIDYFIAYRTPQLGAGFGIAGEEKIIGGPGASDDFGQSAFWREDCASFGDFEPVAFVAPSVSDFAGAQVCHKPEFRCCNNSGTCSIEIVGSPCDNPGPVGTIGDGPPSCDPNPCTGLGTACCLSDGSCQNLSPDVCWQLGFVPRDGTCSGDVDPLNLIDDACEYTHVWQGGGPGPDWVDETLAGEDFVPTAATIGIDTNDDCLADTILSLDGPVLIDRQGGVGRRSARDPVTNSMTTEIVGMVLTGGGVTLRAGAAAGGIGVPLQPSLGSITQQVADPTLADSSFDVFFEVDLGAGLFAYNQLAHRVEAVIDCVPPDDEYDSPTGEVLCLPLLDSPIPGEGVVVANLVIGVHKPFPGACCVDIDGDGHHETCLNSTLTQCNLLGGLFSPGTTCTRNIGACCLDWDGDGKNDTCVAIDRTCCGSQGGLFQGAGTICQGDANSNGIPDNCDIESPTLASPPHDILKNRYISIDPRGASGINPSVMDIKITLTNTLVNGVTRHLYTNDGLSSEWWANAPDANCISIVGPTRPPTPPDWSACGDTVHLTGCPFMPTSTYDIVAVDGTAVSDPPLSAQTQAKPDPKWYGDVVGTFTGTVWEAPNGVVSIDDALAGIKTFQDINAVNATHLSVTDVQPNRPDLPAPGNQIDKVVNIADVLSIIIGFQGNEYPGPQIELCVDP